MMPHVTKNTHHKQTSCSHEQQQTSSLVRQFLNRIASAFNCLSCRTYAIDIKENPFELETKQVSMKSEKIDEPTLNILDVNYITNSNTTLPDFLIHFNNEKEEELADDIYEYIQDFNQLANLNTKKEYLHNIIQKLTNLLEKIPIEKQKEVQLYMQTLIKAIRPQNPIENIQKQIQKLSLPDIEKARCYQQCFHHIVEQLILYKNHDDTEKSILNTMMEKEEQQKFIKSILCNPLLPSHIQDHLNKLKEEIITNPSLTSFCNLIEKLAIYKIENYQTEEYTHLQNIYLELISFAQLITNNVLREFLNEDYTKKLNSQNLTLPPYSVKPNKKNKPLTNLPQEIQRVITTYNKTKHITHFKKLVTQLRTCAISSPKTFFKYKYDQLIYKLKTTLNPIHFENEPKTTTHLLEKTFKETKKFRNSPTEEYYDDIFVTSHNFSGKVVPHTDLMKVTMRKKIDKNYFDSINTSTITYEDFINIFSKLRFISKPKHVDDDSFSIIKEFEEKKHKKSLEKYLLKNNIQYNSSEISKLMIKIQSKHIQILGIGANGNHDLHEDLHNIECVRVHSSLQKTLFETAYARQFTIEGTMNAMNGIHAAKKFLKYGDAASFLTTEKQKKNVMKQAIIDAFITKYMPHCTEDLNSAPKYPLYKKIYTEEGDLRYQLDPKGQFYLKADGTEFQQAPFVKKDNIIIHVDSNCSNSLGNSFLHSSGPKKNSLLTGDIIKGKFIPKSNGQYVLDQTSNNVTYRGDGFIPQKFESSFNDRREWCGSYVGRMLLSSYIQNHYPQFDSLLEKIKEKIETNIHHDNDYKIVTEVLAAYALSISEQLCTSETGTMFFNSLPEAMNFTSQMTPSMLYQKLHDHPATISYPLHTLNVFQQTAAKYVEETKKTVTTGNIPYNAVTGLLEPTLLSISRAGECVGNTAVGVCHNQVVLPIVKARLAKKRGESYNQALKKEIVKNSIPGQLTRACYDTGKKAYLMAGGIDSSGEPDSQIKGLRRDNQYL